MDSIFSRIKLYIAHLGISNNEFGRNIDCSSAQITQMLTLYTSARYFIRQAFFVVSYLTLDAFARSGTAKTWLAMLS